jgi:two-component system chemotaxis sensor kinase CheA
MVLNLAETEGKKVVLKIAGEETTLDESLAKRIGDPLAHLIRNAVDHGIETPKERADQGKPETGVIQLRAYLEGENSVIEISDDGRGMDAHLIRKQAVERNLVTPTEVKRMSENEILNLVFLPGFSTAEKITDVSGRGFGMDVVQNTLRKVNGSVFLKSRPGRGCKISLRFPRSPAGRRNPRGA